MKQRIIILTACLLLCVQASTSAADKPNILVILADDLGVGDMHLLNPGHGKIKTPHLDRLAAAGMTFTDAHSGSSVCTPTRYGLLTGRYAWRTRLQAGVLDGGNDEPLIVADRLTLPGLLRQHGYSTGCIGKWHLGFNSEMASSKPAKKPRGGLPVGSRIVGGPTTRGFDYYWGCSNARTMSSLIENDRVIESVEPIAMLPRLTKRAVDYLGERAADANAGRPFFLYVPLTSPHTPIIPTEEWQGKSGLGDYGDFVMQTDAAVGDLLAALDRHGLTNNTLVVFSSDNGCSPQAGIKKLEAQGHFASGPFRGYKADIWEGGHRVPFFVRWPGIVKPASKSSQTICLGDLMATCAELLGAKLPEAAAEDSISILSLLRGDDKPVHDAVVHHSINGRFAIRAGDWKLAFCSGSGGWGSPKDEVAGQQALAEVQLYNLADDPGEKTNLQQEYPEVVARLTTQMQQFIADGRSTPGAKQPNDVNIQLFKKPIPSPKRTK
ncbi:MAG: arylsulfatase [Planctomycetia bacterium]|nr:arylsulfatase [Planctomycetia bacterium]